MALTVTDPRTIFTTNDADPANWDEATTSLYTDAAEDGIKEGLGFVAYDVDIETLYNFETVTAPPADMTGYKYGGWLRVTNSSDLDTIANGGIQLAVRDTSANESYWYVGGTDTYSGGWVYFVCDFSKTPDANNGTAAVLTAVDDLGVGFKCLTKTLNDNCQMDLMHYGTATQSIIVTGTPDTGTYGTDNVMQELFDIIDTNNYGAVSITNSVFVGRWPIQFNDNSTAACTFEDAGSTFVWADQPVTSDFYKFSLGSSTGITIVRFGTVVGTGDDRQGVNGGSFFQSGNSGWGIDFATNLSGNASNDIKLYGMGITGASKEVLVDDNGKTSLISTNFTNCNEIDPGTTNNGAELLNIFIIDPTGDINNYGYKISQTPTSGTITHNGKKINFITSGTPTTQYMLNFPESSDYDITLTDFTFFGDYSSSTIWHGINSGTNADITINSAGTTNTVSTEYSNTNSGTVTVVAGSVTVKAIATEADGTAIENAIVVLKASDGTGDFPFEDVVTITRATSTATVTHTAHGMATNDKVLIRDADQEDYNIIASITLIDANSYSYTVANTPTTPATGTITSTFIALEGLTDINGELSVSRVYSTAQPVTGYTRKSTSSPYFKEGILNGTISTTVGFTGSAVMTSDE